VSCVPDPSKNGGNLIGATTFKPPEINAMNVKNSIFVNIHKLNVIQNNQTTFNEIKQYIYFYIFEAQTERFCKHH
jgi:hypothetical protein